jgi:predicted nucleotidyltransferase
MSKIALELTPQEWKIYQPAKAIERRKQRVEKQVQHRKQQAWQIAYRAAQILRDQFHAEKVVVFGSLAHETWFTLWSDVDLAVWGIPVDRFYAAVGVITELSEEVAIDLVDPDTCRPALRSVIERDGIEI